MPWTKSQVEKHKEGLTDSQKEKWVSIANSVLQNCLDDGGNQSECEGKAIRVANSKVGQNNNNMEKYFRIIDNYQIRRELHNGQTHIVLPTVLMRTGVHSGSHGPLFHDIDELGRFPASWNGIPVVIDHPQDDEGNNISANDPEIIDREAVGRIFNTHIEGDKLKAEAWIDTARLGQVSPIVKQYVESQQPLNVSVGVFSDQEEKQGQWHGESYQTIARNHRPDHLAILPDAEGACDLVKGCGLGINKNEKGGTNEMTKRKRKDEVMPNYQLVINALKYSGTESGNWSAPDLEDFDVSSSQWDELDKSEKSKVAGHFLIGDSGAENFSDLHYPVVNPSTGKLNENALRAVISGRGAALKGVSGEVKSAARNRARKLLNSEFDADLDVEGNSLSLEQMKQKLEDNDYVISKKGGNIMTKKEKVAKIINDNENFSDKDKQSLEAMEDKYLDELLPKDDDQSGCPEKVDALIDNKNTEFTKEDRDSLLKLNEATLDKLQPQEPARKRKDGPQDNEDKEKEAREQIKRIFGQYDDPEKFIDEMIPGGNLKGTLKNSLNVYKENRKGIIEQITNHNSKWTEEELQKFEGSTLQKLYESIVPQTNYAGIGGGEDDEIDVNEGYSMIPEKLLEELENDGEK